MTIIEQEHLGRVPLNSFGQTKVNNKLINKRFKTFIALHQEAKFAEP
jgi:hypothetical protein